MIKNLISVIIPNYNHANYLDERIESVLNQTYKNYEVIILDDCSSDNSKEIIEKYRNHEKVSQIIYNDFNSGSTFKQWKKGIEFASGDWIWIAESDDCCELNFLEILMQDVSDDIGIITCRTEQIDECGNLCSLGWFWSDELNSQKWKVNYINIGICEINEALKYRNTIPNASAVLFRSDLSGHINEIENYKFAGDWYFYIKCLEKSKIKFISDVLSYQRKHSGTTRNQLKTELEKIKNLEYLSVINYAFKSLVTNKRILSYNNIKFTNYNWLLSLIKSNQNGKYFLFIYLNIPVKLKLLYICKYYLKIDYLK